MLPVPRGGARDRDGDLQRVWHPVVRFTLPDGEVVEARTLYGSEPEPSRPGREELVRFAPSDPTRVALARGLASPGTVGPLLMVLGIGIMGDGLMTLLLWAFLALVLRVPV